MTVLTAQLSLRTDRGTSRIKLENSHSWGIGRGRDNAIPLYDNCASRHHALILLVARHKYYILDLGSRNGTYINGKRITTPTLLQPKDCIGIGENILEFDMAVPTVPSIAQENTEVRLRKRRLVTTLVTDIRNYTKLSQQISERQLCDLTAKWLTAAIEILQKYGGQVEELVGDALLAVWIHEMDADIQQVAITEILDTFRTLQELQSWCAQFNHSHNLPLTWGIGAGVNTGYAYVETEADGRLITLEIIDTTASKAYDLELACRELAFDVAIAESTHQRTPYANVLLSSRQCMVNLPDLNQPQIAYGVNFSAIDQFLEKVSFVFA